MTCRSRAKLVWVLAFVLAPYTHLLATVKHQTEAKLFIDSIIPQLLETALNHDAGESWCISTYKSITVIAVNAAVVTVV